MKDDSAHVCAPTSGASTAKSSVFFVRVGPETIEFLFGNGTTINFGNAWEEQTVLDGSNNPYQAMANWMTGNVGMRLANKNACVRIETLGAHTDTGKLLTAASCGKHGTCSRNSVGNPLTFS